jgi:NAD(P)H dehydrogenase (quinone)
MSVKVAVIYYSATGNVYGLARGVEEGAKEAGAEVCLRKVGELAPEEAIKSNPAWHEHAHKTQDVPQASLDDLEWADAYVFGTPTRYGNVSSQLKQFIDTTAGLWGEGSSRTRLWEASPARTNSTAARSPRCCPCTTSFTTGERSSCRWATRTRPSSLPAGTLMG